VRFFATGVEVAAKESMKTAHGLFALLDKWNGRISEMKLRSDSAVNRMPAFLIGTPVVTVNQVKDAMGVSFPAASAALLKLVEKGILVQQGDAARNRRFVAKEVIDLLNS
jgi:hypothetical protein